MKIHLIVAKNGKTCDVPWIVDAWDEWTEEENERIREVCFKSARERVGGESTTTRLREAVVTVSDDFLEACFRPHEEDAR